MQRRMLNGLIIALVAVGGLVLADTIDFTPTQVQVVETSAYPNQPVFMADPGGATGGNGGG